MKSRLPIRARGPGVSWADHAGAGDQADPNGSPTVIDDTGLAGYFDAEFDFLAELPPPPPPPGMPNPFGEPFISVFTVLPEQLGLKLDSRRGQVDILVIDRAEPPTEN